MTTLQALNLAIKALQAVFRMGEFFQAIIPNKEQYELLDFAADRVQLAISRLTLLEMELREKESQ